MSHLGSASRGLEIQIALKPGAVGIEHGMLIGEATVDRMAKEGACWPLQGCMSYVAFADSDEISRAAAIELVATLLSIAEEGRGLYYLRLREAGFIPGPAGRGLEQPGVDRH